MDSTSFLATTIQRIARKRRNDSLLWLGIVLLGFLSLLALHLALGFSRALTSFLCAYMLVFLLCAALIRSLVLLSRAIETPLESFFLNDLKPYGPLELTVAQIDREACPYAGKLGSFITEHWVISALANSLSFMRLADIVWIYKRLGESKVTFYYAFTVSSGKNYSAQIWSRNGTSLSIPSTDQGVDGLLAQIAKAAPWVTMGYLGLLNEAWMQRRAQFIADVDRKRQQILFASGGSAEASSPAPVASSGEVRPFSQVPVTSREPSPLSGLNRAVDPELIEAYKRKQDRRMRASGFLVLFVGVVFSLIFILPLVQGVLGGAKELSYSEEWVCVSAFLLAAGVYFVALGQRGQAFLETILYRKRWGLILLMVLMCIAIVFSHSAMQSLLRLLGYGSARP